MPVIRIDFDKQKVSDQEVKILSEGVRKVVMDATKEADVFVYANAPHIGLAITPIEVFLQYSKKYITDVDTLVADIKSRLAAWKAETGFAHLINFTFIPMDWKIEIGI